MSHRVASLDTHYKRNLALVEVDKRDWNYLSDGADFGGDTTRQAANVHALQRERFTSYDTFFGIVSV